MASLFRKPSATTWNASAKKLNPQATRFFLRNSTFSRKPSFREKYGKLGKNLATEIKEVMLEFPLNAGPASWLTGLFPGGSTLFQMPELLQKTKELKALRTTTAKLALNLFKKAMQSGEIKLSSTPSTRVSQEYNQYFNQTMPQKITNVLLNPPTPIVPRNLFLTAIQIGSNLQAINNNARNSTLPTSKYRNLRTLTANSSKPLNNKNPLTPNNNSLSQQRNERTKARV